MSKKAFKWMVANLIFVGIMTLLFFWIKSGILSVISNGTARNITNIVLWLIYGIADFVVVIWFLYYWWCDRKWTQLKHWARKKFYLG